MLSSLLLIALIGVSSPLSAQRAETRGEQSPAQIAGRDAIVNYGLTPEQVQELTKAAAAGAVGPLAKEIIDLSNRLGVTQGAALTLLRIVGQRDVPFEQVPEKLAEVASQYQQAQAQLAALNPQNPSARGLVEQAQAEIMAGNFIKAHERLRQARQAQIAAAQQARALRQQAQVAEDEQLIQAAASSAAEGDLAMISFRWGALMRTHALAISPERQMPCTNKAPNSATMARARAARLGCDAEQSRQCASNAGRA
jgi:hypothetical protein